MDFGAKEEGEGWGAEYGGRALRLYAQKFFVFEKNFTIATFASIGQLQEPCPPQAENSGRKTGRFSMSLR